MNSVGIGKKLTLSIAALLVLTAVLGWISVAGVKKTTKSFRTAVDRRVAMLVLADRLEVAVANLRSGQRGEGLFKYNKDYPASYTACVEQYRNSVESANSTIDKLLVLSDAESMKQQLRDTKQTVAQAQAVNQRVQELYAENKLDEGLTHAMKNSVFDKIVKLAKEIAAQQQQELEKEKAELARLESVMQWQVFGSLLLSALAGAFVLFVVWQTTGTLRQISSGLLEGTEQVAGAASQVSSSSQSLAQGASEQAASLEQTSSSTEEISSMTGQNSENAEKAARVVDRSHQRLSEANEKLGEMVAAMQEISSASDQVAKIIKVIDEIAFQTNILALNAAVEAARAGESGMGFAVVADEVRNLAQRCAQAAKDTQSLIETAIVKSAQGTQKVRQFEEAITAVTGDSQEVKTLVDEVSVGSQEQKKGLGQIAGSISQMEQLTQKTAASAEESAAAGEELNAQADTLRDFVRQLVRFVEGGSEKISAGSAFVRKSSSGAAPRRSAKV